MQPYESAHERASLPVIAVTSSRRDLCYRPRVDTASAAAPRILILESDKKTCATLRRYAVKGWRGASVTSSSGTLPDAVREGAKLGGFDIVLAGCDFSRDGSAANPTFAALRALAADPASPAVVLLTTGGSEYTAVQAVRSGALDCIPRSLLGREQIFGAVQRVLLSRRQNGEATDAVTLFGYDIRRRLACRDNVSVHVAYSAERAKEVVLKVLHRGRGSLSRDRNFERFVAEFKRLCDIDDPAVAEIYDFRVTSAYCYIAMEYFPAGDLGRRLTRALPADEALRTAAEVADALSIIHAAGIVHRDLKPGNVMFRDDGSLALIDFGIAESREGDASAQTREITGTPYYMSPEQARGETTDERTDLYAVGVMLYQMLTGEKPYAAESAEAILALHCSAPIPALPKHRAALQPLIDRLLAKAASQRFASARELIEAIDQARGAGATASVASAPSAEAPESAASAPSAEAAESIASASPAGAAESIASASSA
jgi:ActR/RegA family two-component response regulator